MNTVVAIPMASAVPAIESAQGGENDTLLLQLGKQLDAAWEFENRCYQAIEKTSDEIGLDAQLKILRYRGARSIDSRLLRYLGQGEWINDQYAFATCDVRRLLEEKPQLGERADRRIDELCRAQDAVEVLQENAAFVEANERAERANRSTSAIVSRIERTPARSMVGLIVKAKAVLWCRTGDLEDDVSGKATDTRILQSILEDIAKMGNRLG